jgi:hypothetical protein
MESFNGYQYLLIAFANAIDGLDKLNYEERILQAEAILAKSDQEIADVINDQKEKYLAYKYYREITEYRDKGKLETNVLIGLDATASGMQLLGVLTRCERTMRIANVLDTPNRADPYTHVYRVFNSKLNHKGTATRSEVKQAIMTSFYGSQATPRNLFPNPGDLETFHQSLAEEAPGAWAARNYLLSLHNPDVDSVSFVMPDNHHVYLPYKSKETLELCVDYLNNPIQHQVVMNKPVQRDVSIAANLVHAVDGYIVRELVRMANISQGSLTGLISAVKSEIDFRVLHENNETKVINRMPSLAWMYQDWSQLALEELRNFYRYLTIFNATNHMLSKHGKNRPHKPVYDLLPIHDSFWMHPNYGDYTRAYYSMILAEIYQSDLFSDLVCQLTDTAPEKLIENPINTDVLNSIYNSNYSIC